MKRISKEIEENIVQDYLNNINTITISRKYNISRSTVQKYLIKNNVEFNKHPITSRIFNHHFFDNYTPDSCYWAGFILADGYIRKNRNSLEICLSHIDGDHLLKFTKSIGLNEDIRIYKNNTCRVSICSDVIKESLLTNFEIFNKKSLVCFISNKIPLNMLSHFIRGYFDGDGCFSSENRFSFIGTYDTCDTIRNYFKNNGITKQDGNIPCITEKQSKNKMYYVKYSKNLSLKIFDLLFKDSTDLTRLDRKYKKILSYVNRAE